jgi:hypothetical protein
MLLPTVKVYNADLLDLAFEMLFQRAAELVGEKETRRMFARHGPLKPRDRARRKNVRLAVEYYSMPEDSAASESWQGASQKKTKPCRRRDAGGQRVAPTVCDEGADPPGAQEQLGPRRHLRHLGSATFFFPKCCNNIFADLKSTGIRRQINLCAG